MSVSIEPAVEVRRRREDAVISESSDRAARETRQNQRARLRRLDACLDVLERLRERNETLIPAGVAVRLRAHVPGLAGGMPISGGVRIVLSAQEALLSPARGGIGPNRRSSADRVLSLPAHSQSAGAAQAIVALTEGEARDLTDRIKVASRRTCFLLLEAHERRAWASLGYRTWENYVRSEFDQSRSRSYQLLDQGRVIRTLEEAAGVSRILDISALAAEQLKPHLPKVTEVLRARVAGVPVERRAALINTAVREQRRAIIAQRRERVAGGSAPSPNGGRFDLARLMEAVRTLACMPPVDEVVARVPGPGPCWLREVMAADAWLSTFTRSITRTHGSTGPFVNAPIPTILPPAGARSPTSSVTAATPGFPNTQV
jgi:hypothetical protein